MTSADNTTTIIKIDGHEFSLVAVWEDTLAGKIFKGYMLYPEDTLPPITLKEEL
jgi:hypothetical protein